MNKLKTNDQLLKNAVMRWLSIELIVLHIPFFWHLEDEWDWSDEMDYCRKPRRFYRNKFFKEYVITEVFTDKSKLKSKTKLVIEFCKKLRENKLLMDRTYLTYSV